MMQVSGSGVDFVDGGGGGGDREKVGVDVVGCGGGGEGASTGVDGGGGAGVCPSWAHKHGREDKFDVFSLAILNTCYNESC